MDLILGVCATEVPVGAHVFRDPRFHLLLDPSLPNPKMISVMRLLKPT